MQVGTTKDQSLYNKPSAAVHPGALDAGTLPQYNNLHIKFRIPRCKQCIMNTMSACNNFFNYALC